MQNLNISNFFGINIYTDGDNKIKASYNDGDNFYRCVLNLKKNVLEGEFPPTGEELIFEWLDENDNREELLKMLNTNIFYELPSLSED